MPDPSYPCNRHFVSAADGTPVLVPADGRQSASSSARRRCEAALERPTTRGVLLASPSNPTGTSIAPGRTAPHPRRRARQAAASRSSTRSTSGLSYDDTFGHSALAIDDDVISINSFSKYFNMTGWRLGWLVRARGAGAARSSAGAEPVHLPEHGGAARGARLLRAREHRRVRAPPRRVQGAARLVHSGARARWACTVPVMPDGAFYAWADCSAAAQAGRRRQLGLRLRDDEARPRGASRRAATSAPPRPAASSAFPPPIRWRSCRKRPARLKAVWDEGSACRPRLYLAVRVYWEDTDAGGIVFYANYLKFFERARTEWLRSLGVEPAARCATTTGGMFVVSETAVRYLAPARLDDELICYRRRSTAGGRAVSDNRAAGTARGGTLLAEGTIRIGWVDAGTLRPAPHPRTPSSTVLKSTDEPRPLDPHARAARQPRRAAGRCCWPAAGVARQLDGDLPQAVRLDARVQVAQRRLRARVLVRHQPERPVRIRGAERQAARARWSASSPPACASS